MDPASDRSELYVRRKLLGKGSYGCAHVVASKVDGREYVEKEIRFSTKKQSERDSATSEINVLRTVNHPNIIRYMDHFESRGALYIIMEYADGGDLYHKIRSRNGQLFEEREIMMYFTQLCLALSYLHHRKILHRDLKTQNIFLTSSGMVKLGDFGISTVLRNTFEMKRTVCGTPYYFSPELCLNKPYNNRSDVWALGCVLYELTTLNHAFDGKSMKALVQKILKGVFPPVSDKYSPQLRSLISDMLQIDPAMRPTVQQIIRTPLIRDSLNDLQVLAAEYEACIQRERILANQAAGPPQHLSPPPQQPPQRSSPAQPPQKPLQAPARPVQRPSQPQPVHAHPMIDKEREQQILREQLELRRRERLARAQRAASEVAIQERMRQKQQLSKVREAQNLKLERQWDRNMREQVEEQKRKAKEEEMMRRHREEEQAALGNGGGRVDHLPPAPLGNGAEKSPDLRNEYLERMEAARRNKLRIAQEEFGKNHHHGDGKAEMAAKPTGSSSNVRAAKVVKKTSQPSSTPDMRRAAYLQLRRETEANRRKAIESENLSPLAKATGSRGSSAAKGAERSAAVVRKKVIAPSEKSDGESATHEEEGKQGSPSRGGSPSAASDSEEGGVLQTAIAAALRPGPNGDDADFDDAAPFETDPLKFMLNGETIQLANMKASDSAMQRMENLRVFLEANLEENVLLTCYNAMRDVDESTSEDVMGKAEAMLPKGKEGFAHVIFQLVTCENYYSKGLIT